MTPCAERQGSDGSGLGRSSQHEGWEVTPAGCVQSAEDAA